MSVVVVAPVTSAGTAKAIGARLAARMVARAKA
jgi:hypothetical protein